MKCCRCSRPIEVIPSGSMAGRAAAYTIHGSLTVHMPGLPSTRPSIEAYGLHVCQTCWPIVSNVLRQLAERINAAYTREGGRPWPTR